MTDPETPKTEIVDTPPLAVMTAPSVVLRVAAGPDTGKSIVLDAERASVGTHLSNALVLTDRSVSGFHFEVTLAPHGLLVTDLGSTNGTFVSKNRIERVYVNPGGIIAAGRTAIEVTRPGQTLDFPIFPDARFGSLIGTSVAMRRLFAAIVRLAPRDVPILIQGETGTGKENVARELHERSARRDGPFVVVDCGSIPGDIAESELFGHVKGAFTGAASDRRGAFEAADGGTLFLDEIGELDMALQPRLLRAIEARQVKRVGSDSFRAVNTRVIAATHRDLRLSVNGGAFREDLYYRIAVATLWIPPLRERPDDIPLLLSHFYAETARAFGLPPEMAPLADETRARLASLPWHGNCRELRNFVDRSLALSGDAESAFALGDALDGRTLSAEAGREATIRFDLVFKDAKLRWVDHFEKAYVARRLADCGGNITRAAREMELDRSHFLSLLKKHGIR